jgi:diguanylate cyclase (GGDEF)-like protein
MARLRDELDRGRLYDQTGMLLDGRYVERDLRIRLAMAGEGVPVSVLMGDLDHFKQVNDQLGHTMGDEALQRYFSVLRDVVSAAGGDAYRKGVGDETIAILTKISSEQAVQVAEAVREGVRAELAYLLDKGLKQRVTVSLGVLTTTDREPPARLIKQVDRLLYQAKEGRNRVVAARHP